MKSSTVVQPPTKRFEYDPVEEARFFKEEYKPNTFPPGPALAVDVVLLTVIENRPHVLLLHRTQFPERGRWALPGGFFIDTEDEDLDSAVTRILKKKTGLEDLFVEQLYTFSDLDRDPRSRYLRDAEGKMMHIITVAYFALIPPERAQLSRTSAPVEAEGGPEPIAWCPLSVPWEGLEGGPVQVFEPTTAPHTGEAAPAEYTLGFDHAMIIGTAVKRLRGKLDYSAVGYELLPATFPLRALQNVHEAILGQKLNKDSFRRRMLATKQLVETGDSEKDVGHRPAMLYRVKGSEPA